MWLLNKNIILNSPAIFQHFLFISLSLHPPHLQFSFLYLPFILTSMSQSTKENEEENSNLLYTVGKTLADGIYYIITGKKRKATHVKSSSKSKKDNKSSTQRNLKDENNQVLYSSNEPYKPHFVETKYIQSYGIPSILTKVYSSRSWSTCCVSSDIKGESATSSVYFKWYQIISIHSIETFGPSIKNIEIGYVMKYPWIAMSIWEEMLKYNYYYSSIRIRNIFIIWTKPWTMKFYH